ncbi:MAG: hypothetical protein ABI216_12365 [Devosia sp.]
MPLAIAKMQAQSSRRHLLTLSQIMLALLTCTLVEAAIAQTAEPARASVAASKPTPFSTMDT